MAESTIDVVILCSSARAACPKLYNLMYTFAGKGCQRWCSFLPSNEVQDAHL